MPRIACTLALLVSLAVSIAAQERDLEASRERIARNLEFLSSDELAGRDSPSPGLDRALDWSIEELKKNGIAPAFGERGFVYRYEVPGWRIAAADCKAEIRRGGETIELVPGKDFRLFEVGGAYSCSRETAARLDEAEAFAKGLLMRRKLERPVIVEVAEDGELWRRGEALSGLGRRRNRGAPVLLVPEGRLEDGKLELSLEIPEPSAADVPLRNVVGLLEGRSKPDEFVLVTAHIDHIGVGLPRGKDKDDRIYNGANDDASGSTAVIELAALFGALKPEARPARSILFVLFSGEEKGLLGSKAMAADSPWPLERIVAQVNIEMIGRPERGKKGEAWVTGRSKSDFEEIAARAMKRAGVKMGQFAMEARLYAASDNWPYAQRGVIAHSISASGLRGVDYHETSDEFERIDLAHMTRIVSGIAQAVLDFADLEARPRATKP